MSYTVPTLKETIQSHQGDIATRLSGADATPPRSVLGILARAVSGAVDELNGYIAWLATQIIYDTADDDLAIRWASIWRRYRNNPTAASGAVIFTGTSGTTVPADTLLSRSDGVQYQLDADVVLADGTGNGTVTCTSVGANTDCDAGSTLTLATSISGVAAAVTVGSDGLGGGADIETIDSLKSRLLERIQNPPMGGSEADFKSWAKDALTGITRVWVIPGWLGSGTVGLTFMMDDRAEPVPLAADVTVLQTAIDAERPVSCNTTVFVPTRKALDPVITLVPDSTTARTAVATQLATLLLNEGTAKGGTIYLSQIRTAIGAASGVTDYTLASPIADVTTAVGEIPVVGTITWG
jgi:uncharacterized phage protein gp47/JayE